MENVENNIWAKPVIDKWTGKLTKLGLVDVCIEWSDLDKPELSGKGNIFISFTGIDISNTNIAIALFGNIDESVKESILNGDLKCNIIGNRIQTSIGISVKWDYELQELPSDAASLIIIDFLNLIDIVYKHVYDELVEVSKNQVQTVNNVDNYLRGTELYLYDIDGEYLYPITVKSIVETSTDNYDFTYQVDDTDVECTIGVTIDQLSSLTRSEDVELEDEYILRNYKSDINDIEADDRDEFASNVTDTDPEDWEGGIMYLYDADDEHFIGIIDIDQVDQVDDEDPNSDYELNVSGAISDIFQLEKSEMIFLLQNGEITVDGEYILCLNKREEDEPDEEKSK